MIVCTCTAYSCCVMSEKKIFFTRKLLLEFAATWITLSRLAPSLASFDENATQSPDHRQLMSSEGNSGSLLIPTEARVSPPVMKPFEVASRCLWVWRSRSALKQMWICSATSPLGASCPDTSDSVTKCSCPRYMFDM